MTEDIKALSGLVWQLNGEFHNQTEDSENGVSYEPFTYVGNGDEQLINMFDHNLWNSYHDEREFIDAKDEYEDIEVFVRRKAQEFITAISKVRLQSAAAAVSLNNLGTAAVKDPEEDGQYKPAWHDDNFE